MKLLVGLGNPGEKYTYTRHNIGFIMIERLVADQGQPFSYQNKRGAEVAEMTLNQQKVICCKPMTFMNRSGGPVQQITHFYKIDPADIVVIHDEIDLPVGTIKYKTGGSAAGHNGLKDMIAKLGTADFSRIRIGVGRPTNQGEVSNYVLSNFSGAEKQQLDDWYDEVKRLVEKEVV